MKVILASSSPRRVELLTHMGIEFKSQPADIDETPLKKETPVKMVARLAEGKAMAVFDSAPKGEVLIIAADTTVVHPNGKKILAKPENHVESFQMIQSIQGKTHDVLTGFSVLHRNAKGKVFLKTKVIQTKVKIRKLTKKEILAYVATGEGLDKAGAYGAQGVGMGLIESIQGSYTNVVGLPVAELWEEIKKWIPKA